MSEPDYGDVMVFRFPHNESVNFIKRVVGLPGDSIVYENKQVTVNGRVVEQDLSGEFVIDSGPNRKTQTQLLRESFADGESHRILHDDRRSSPTPWFSKCRRIPILFWETIEITVTIAGFGDSYQMRTSLGGAFFIWFSWNSSGDRGVDWNRIAEAIE